MNYLVSRNDDGHFDKRTYVFSDHVPFFFAFVFSAKSGGTIDNHRAKSAATTSADLVGSGFRGGAIDSAGDVAANQFDAARNRSSFHDDCTCANFSFQSKCDKED